MVHLLHRYRNGKPFKIREKYFYHNDNELYIFQYIASDLTWKAKGLKVLQKTGYPEEQGTTLEFTCEDPVRLAVMVRYPYWAGTA